MTAPDPLPRCQQGRRTPIRPPPSFPVGWGGAGRAGESPPRILHRVGCREGAARTCTPQPHLLPPSWSSIWRQVRSGEGNPEVRGVGGLFPGPVPSPQLSLCSPGFPPQEAEGGRSRGGPQAWAPPNSGKPLAARGGREGATVGLGGGRVSPQRVELESTGLPGLPPTSKAKATATATATVTVMVTATAAPTPAAAAVAAAPATRRGRQR